MRREILTVVMLIAILVDVLAVSGVFVLADPVSYTIQGQEKDGTWTPGTVDGYLECERIPFRLNATYNFNEPGVYNVTLGALYNDTAIPPNRGIDYLADFTIDDPNGALDPTYTVTIAENSNVHPLPWQGGPGTGDTTYVAPNGVREIHYYLKFKVLSWQSGHKMVTFYWTAHLALSPRGAFFWTGPPSHLQVFADPPSGGVKTVNVMLPEMMTATKMVEAQDFLEYDWTFEKTADPTSLTLTPGQTGTITYNFTVQRIQTDTFRMRGNITIQSHWNQTVCVDVLDQVQNGTSTLPNAMALVDNARWGWNDRTLPANGSIVLYFPGPTSSDWFNLPAGSVNNVTTYYNNVWVGLMANLACPTADPLTANWQTDYDRVINNSTSFNFVLTLAEGSDPPSVSVSDNETPTGSFNIIGETYVPTAYPWIVTSNTTLQLVKTIQCTGPGDGNIIDYAEAVPASGGQPIGDSNTVTVSVYQTTSTTSTTTTGTTTTGTTTTGTTTTGTGTIAPTFDPYAVPDFPLGLSLLAILMMIVYGLIRRKANANTRPAD